MKIRITPGRLSGQVTPPASKSQCHRLIIAAALTSGVSVLNHLSPSQDISATLRCVEALGAQVSGAEISGLSPRFDGELPQLDCGESGSTLRFLVPVALAVRGGGVFTGQGRLMERPMRPYEQLFHSKGIDYVHAENSITVQGRLRPGRYELPGNISSQFISGLMFALPLLEGESEIVLTSPLQSAGYVDMTVDALAQFGMTVEAVENGWRIPGSQRGTPCQITAEGDWSQAAFWMAAELLGSPVEIGGMNPHSVQGDRVMVEYCRALAGEGEVSLDVSQCPDLAPALAAIAALRAGEYTHLTGAGRLRMKESDRIESIAQTLNALGAQVSTGEDSLTVLGKSRLNGGTCQSCNDHRIAMMAAVAATRAVFPVEILGAECVAKSYPRFWADYRMLGGRAEETFS